MRVTFSDIGWVIAFLAFLSVSMLIVVGYFMRRWTRRKVFSSRSHKNGGPE